MCIRTLIQKPPGSRDSSPTPPTFRAGGWETKTSGCTNCQFAAQLEPCSSTQTLSRHAGFLRRKKSQGQQNTFLAPRPPLCAASCCTHTTLRLYASCRRINPQRLRDYARAGQGRALSFGCKILNPVLIDSSTRIAKQRRRHEILQADMNLTLLAHIGERGNLESSCSALPRQRTSTKLSASAQA